MPVTEPVNAPTNVVAVTIPPTYNPPPIPTPPATVNAPVVVDVVVEVLASVIAPVVALITTALAPNPVLKLMLKFLVFESKLLAPLYAPNVIYRFGIEGDPKSIVGPEPVELNEV